MYVYYTRNFLLLSRAVLPLEAQMLSSRFHVRHCPHSCTPCAASLTFYFMSVAFMVKSSSQKGNAKKQKTKEGKCFLPACSG